MTETLETAMTTDLMLDDDIPSEFELDTDVDIEFDDNVLFDVDVDILIVDCDLDGGSTFTTFALGEEEGGPWEAEADVYFAVIAQAPSDAELPLVPDSA